jgi:hypothetical protein
MVRFIFFSSLFHSCDDDVFVDDDDDGKSEMEGTRLLFSMIIVSMGASIFLTTYRLM